MKFKRKDDIDMTVDEKLDLLLEDMSLVKKDVNSLKVDMESVKTEITSMKTEIKSLKCEMQEVKAKVDSIDTRVGRIETDVADIKMTVENEIRPNIMRVAEGHFNLLRKQAELTQEVVKLSANYEIYDLNLKYHSVELEKLKAARY
jgi:chromosome segregation ATPase